MKIDSKNEKRKPITMGNGSMESPAVISNVQVTLESFRALFVENIEKKKKNTQILFY